MNAFNENFAAGGSDITVGSVEHRRHIGRAMQTFRAAQGAALDLGLSRREATAAAIHAVKQIHGLDMLAALGLAPEGAQGEAEPTAGGDDADPASSHPEAGEAAGDGSLPPRSRDRNRLFADLLAPELGPDLNDAIDRLAELWRIEPDAERLPGDDEFVDDAALRAAGVPPTAMTARLLHAMAREPRFSANGWCEDVERDHDHGSHRLAMLSPAFLQAAEDFQSLFLSLGFGCGAVRSISTSDVYLAAPAAIAAAVALEMEHVPAGAQHFPENRSELFSVPQERIREYLRRVA